MAAPARVHRIGLELTGAARQGEHEPADSEALRSCSKLFLGVHDGRCTNTAQSKSATEWCDAGDVRCARLSTSLHLARWKAGRLGGVPGVPRRRAIGRLCHLPHGLERSHPSEAHHRCDGKIPHEEHDLAWSPDSKHIAFLSDSGANDQLGLFVAGYSPVASPLWSQFFLLASRLQRKFQA
jgi:hypothetical protein